jgi:hypothetical protein
VLSTSLWCPAFLANGRAPSIPIASGAAFASLGQPPPPPDVAADPEPGMIAMTRDTLSVKDHSFAVCADCLPGITIGSRVKLGAPYSPSRSGPAFLSSILECLNRGCANFAITAF